MKIPVEKHFNAGERYKNTLQNACLAGYGPGFAAYILVRRARLIFLPMPAENESSS
jgi:hypothetical protein